tara:strand:+ start:4711 stop:5112 length:402 start_codon:yes stop_codon:yes gene_type:complete
MEFNIRKLNPSDYEDVLVKWWKEWNFEPPSKSFLPDQGEGGLMVLLNEKPVCAGFIYFTNSKVSWIEWIISDKKHRVKRKECLKMLIENLTSVSKKNGMEYIFANNNNRFLIDTYLNLDFKKGNISTELIKIL